MNHPGQLPPTSLIVASRNRPALLAAAVESILRGDELPDELIVVDQSDAEHPSLGRLTGERGRDVRYLWSRSVGLSRANNVGVAAARHALLVFTHDDVLATPTWFGDLVRVLVEAGPRAVVTGRVLPAEAELAGGIVPTLKVDEQPATYQGRIGEDVLYPLNMALYRSAIDEVGLFDERLGPGTWYPAAEDNDFGFRLLEAGYRVIYHPGPTLHHRAWRSDALGLRWSYGRGMGAFYAKWLNLRDRYMLQRMVADVGAVPYRFACHVRRRPAQAYGEVLYGLGVLAGAGRWWLSERRTR